MTPEQIAAEVEGLRWKVERLQLLLSHARNALADIAFNSDLDEQSKLEKAATCYREVAAAGLTL